MKYLLFVFAICLISPKILAQPKVSKSDLNKVYKEVKTPFKFGLIIAPKDNSRKIDSPTVFRKGGYWFMTYVEFDGIGYETWLARSRDLLHWEKQGKIMSHSKDDSLAWDSFQKAGYISLVDFEWGGSYEVSKFDDKYWMSYIGGNQKGYEVEPLSIGMAFSSKSPTKIHEWGRLPEPILSADDMDVRWWENKNRLFKSSVIEDKERITGHQFIMYYNAVGDSLKNNKPSRWYERIGMAVSDDMVHWKRYKTDPVMQHEIGITGDAIIQKMGDLYVMFYFGAFWKDSGGAFNRFAVSRDLVNWTDWEGDNLIESSEKYDDIYAHKSSVIKHNGIVYHFYCAVNKNDQRGIAVGTSKDLGKSKVDFVSISNQNKE